MNENPVSLTIGMAAYEDPAGVYFTCQSIRLHGAAELHQLGIPWQLLIVDNSPKPQLADLAAKLVATYVHMPSPTGTAPPRNRVFREAICSHVLCVDSHILLRTGALLALGKHLQANPESRDLLQGPLLYDSLDRLGTHFKPVWNDFMYGQWDSDKRVADGKPFEIPMQGLGLFACRRDAWPGFHPDFRGFGGEEGYIHGKFRQAGAKTLCLPDLQWVHLFRKPGDAPPYPASLEQRAANYFIGWHDLGWDTSAIRNHFAEKGYAHVADRGLAIAKPSMPDKATAAPIALMTAKGKPLVSCLCATFATKSRLPLIEEAIQCFLDQDLADAELLVVNDNPDGQIVYAGDKRVLVVNLPARCTTVGEKHNLMAALATGEFLACWDDDDIHLPNRLSGTLARLRDADADYYNPKAYWYMPYAERKLRSDHAIGVCANGSIFRKTALAAIGYWSAEQARYDADLHAAMVSRAAVRAAVAGVNCEKLPIEKWGYIYRWGVGTHVSAGEPQQRFDAIGAQSDRRFLPAKLAPHYNLDYRGLVAKALQGGGEAEF